MSTKKTTTLVETTTPGTGRKSGGTDAVLARRSQQSEWARVWHSLPASARNGFQRLAAQSNPPLANGKPRVSAFFFFANCNTALVNAGAEPILVPPAAPQPPQTLPKQVTLVSSIAGGGFSLKIQCAAFSGKIVVYAAAPAMADTTLHEGDFKRIGCLTALPATTLGALYAAAFRAPQDGEKVAIKMMGVSPSGYTTVKQGVDCITTAMAAEAEDTDDADTTDAALKIA